MTARSQMPPDEMVASLRRMRDEIDLLLAALAPDRPSSSALAGATMGAAALHVLREATAPMRAAAIMERMVVQGYASKNGRPPSVQSVRWALSLRLRDHGDVERVGWGMWKAR